MAAPGRHVGQFIQRKGRYFINNLEQFWAHRSFGSSSALQQQAAESNSDLTETVVIPRKKTWSKEAVLEALTSTAGQDPTAFSYQFQDDPYLSPRTTSEFKLYSLSQESGRSAAKYFVNNFPKFFTRDYAEPHIPCLMPETVSLHLEEISEEALKERISLRKVGAAVDMYDQLLQSGAAVSMEVTHDLLDLISFCCDKDPETQDQKPETEDTEDPEEEVTKKKARGRRAFDFIKPVWKENNNAERIFNLLPERDTRCYSALIRGMVKHGAFSKAFNYYADLLNNRLTADLHTFNALISASPEVREKSDERLELLIELLNQMNQQKVQPNLQTFNAVLKALRRCGGPSRTHGLQALNEMKALGIAPSLATFNNLLNLFYRRGSGHQNNTDILHEVMAELEGRSFTCQEPDDIMFFMNAMRICQESKDLELGYKVQSFAEVGENWRLMGDAFQQSIYYGRFFNLLCMMEHVDTVLQWYRRLVPSMYYPNPQGFRDLLQALDTDNRLEMLPTVWKEIRSLGHENKSDLVGEVLTLMARDKHSPEVQEAFATCALDIKSVYDAERLEWSVPSLSHISTLLLRANKTSLAWDMLRLFKAKNRVPLEGLMEEFLSVCQSSGSPKEAVEVVQLSAAFCMPTTPNLAQRVLAEFELTEEQRAVLLELETATEP